MLFDLLMILLGVALLYGGGEALVRGAVALARSLGMSPLVIGLTVVSFGTSAPELASTMAAAFAGSPEVAFSNVVGSNIANIGLILGLTAMIWPLSAPRAAFLVREVPFMIASGGLLFLVVVDAVVDRVEGAVLFGLLVLFLLYLLKRDAGGEKLATAFESEYGAVKPKLGLALVQVVVGIVLLVAGGHVLVKAAIAVARDLGIAERVIGLTMVALGTSLPELAASLVAAARREGDLVLGNIVGSNVFNVLCILGLTSMVHPISVIPADVWIDLAVMLALSGLVWPFLASRLKIARIEGFAFLAIYFGYVIWLFS